MLTLTDNQLDPNGYWEKPLRHEKVTYYTNDLFDQNGYDLCHVEILYAKENLTPYATHRSHIETIKSTWFTQSYKKSGAVLNHGLLFERKGFSGAAREQLKRWAEQEPVFHKLLNIKPKWGLDFSMDYYDHEGNTLEVLHWEYDGFNYDEINETKLKIEPVLLAIDWEDGAKQLLKTKDEWYYLDFFKQSAYKCNYFGICNERWKMVVWQ